MCAGNEHVEVGGCRQHDTIEHPMMPDEARYIRTYARLVDHLGRGASAAGCRGAGGRWDAAADRGLASDFAWNQ